ncbi:hypothetical protein Ccrd_015054 [Cynara cardunculus var. scolymus]|uniref:Retrotransposon gag domain-containing protein n=1 Tax=Cynara cardunculus var. scolymus TaxID=59895 RepID=A0A103YCJ6_CYNCS|nr:hypothetical protein Ccrd_015054 [Cynara cardunculus var. scolymus]
MLLGSSLYARFAVLATRMEQYIQGQYRELVDQAYIKIWYQSNDPWTMTHSVASRVDEMEGSIGTVQAEVGSLREDVQLFDGDDLEGWLFRCEWFFHMDFTLDSATLDNAKVKLASIHIEDGALQWYKSFRRNMGVIDEPTCENYMRHSKGGVGKEFMKILWQTSRDLLDLDPYRITLTI